MKHSLASVLTSVFLILALTFGAAGITPAQASSNPFINEILINPPGTDAPNEYIELRGGANETLPTGTYLVGIEGDASSNPGDVQDIFNLSGLSFGGNGYLVLRQSGSTYSTDPAANVVTATGSGWGSGGIHSADSGTDIENASATFLLINAASAPTLSDDIDSDNNGSADGAVYSSWTIHDGVGSLDNSPAGDFGYASPTFFNSAGGGIGPGAQSVSFTASYLGRATGNTTGNSPADWVASDLSTGTAPNYTLNAATFPANYAGAALNHIGASNFLTFSTATPIPTSTSTTTVTSTATATPTSTATVPAATANPGNIYISEMLINPPGTDTGAEIIELRGPASGIIPANTYLIAIDGDTGSEGTLDNIFNLGGLSFGSNGFMVLRQNASTYTIDPNASVYTMTGTSAAGSWSSTFSTGGDLENGSMTLLLIRSAVAPTIADDIDSANSGATNAPYTSWTVLDGIAVIDGSNERAYAPINYIEQSFTSAVSTGILLDASAVAGEIEYVARASGDTAGSTATDWLGANLAGTLSNMTVEGTRVTQASYANRAVDHWGSSNFPIQVTVTPTNTATEPSTETPTGTFTRTPTIAPTGTMTGIVVYTLTPTNTVGASPTGTATASPSGTYTITPTVTLTKTTTHTLTPTITKTNTATPTNTVTPTETATHTPTFVPTDTATSTKTLTVTATEPPTERMTSTFTVTPTLTATETAMASPSGTYTATPTVTTTNTDIASPSKTFTLTPTATATETTTATITPTKTTTSTLTSTLTATPTLTTTSTKSPTATMTRTPGTFTITLTSIAAQDGWMLESAETSNIGSTINSTSTTFNLGDDAAKKQYRGLLSFSTGAGIPDNATITGVILKVKQQAIVGGGNPVAIFQGFMVDIKNGFFGTATTMQAADFQTTGSGSYGPFLPTPIGSIYSINLVGGKTLINKLSSNNGLTQIRLRFKLDDNNNAITNYLSLYSGNTAVANRPQLVITYTLP